MRPFAFAEMIGRSLFIGLKGCVLKKDGTPVDVLIADLAGVECGGLWVRSATIDELFEEQVWNFEMEVGGPEAVGALEIGHFIPFSEIRFVKIHRPGDASRQSPDSPRE